ncbi:MAG: cupin domain-containing protein [Acidimicrobiia bacterium]
MESIDDEVAGIIEKLNLDPHPEGGHYRETWRAAGPGRASGTAIYFLLAEGEVSHWHRIDAVEIWHFHAGAALELSIWKGEGSVVDRGVLGSDLHAGQSPQLSVPSGAWQAARSLGPWTLAGCTVSPGFEFDHFELAEPGWEPPAG